jgi:Protein of unknown function (DUF3592)
LEKWATSAPPSIRGSSRVFKYLRFLMLAVGLVLMAGSATLLVKTHLRAVEARGWPRAQGRIIESRVETIQPQDVGTAGDFRPHVRYDYDVHGHVFHGQTIWLDDANRSFDSSNVAARELVFLEEGSEAEVIYNPADPHEAALVVEEHAWPKIFLFLFGALLVRLGWRRRRQQPGTALATT